MESRSWPRSAGLVRFGLAVVALLTACSGVPPERVDSRPHIVLITLDTLRADALGPYRKGASLTPRIDAFAAQSIVFEQAITPIGTTFPAHASLFTGQYPKSHGVRWNGDSLAEDYQTLAEMLAAAGYDTAAFVALPTMLDRGGLGQGFDTWVQRGDASGFSLPGPDVVRQAEQWLENLDGDRPILLWAHLFEAHSPYPIGPYARQEFHDAGYDGPLAEGASTELFYALGEEIPLTQREQLAVRALYDQQVVDLDRYVGELLDLLSRHLMDRARLIVLTADHGQSLGEHDAVGHGFLLWQTVLQVPLIIGGDAVEKSGVREASLVSLLDLKPTILEAAGIDAEETTGGRALWPVLAGGRLPSRILFAEARALADNVQHDPNDAKSLAVFDGSSKLIWRPDGYRFHDLSLDPHEAAGQQAAVTAGHRGMIEMAERFSESMTEIADWEDLDPAVLEELRALGYVD